MVLSAQAEQRAPLKPQISAHVRSLVEIEERTEVAARRHGRIATVYGRVAHQRHCLLGDVGRTE
jgi:hypothetical protein